MCGRFALTAEKRVMEEFLALLLEENAPARYNIAPTQPILVVIAGESREPGSNMPQRRALLARWGFIPGWVKDPRDFPLLINARAETAAEKASFRAAMRHRPQAEARALRERNGVTVFLAGLLIAGFMAIPLVNLLTPLFAAAMMVHLYKAIAARDQA